MGPPTGASGGRDATADPPAPLAPRSCASRAGLASVAARALVAVLDDSPLRSGSEAVDGPMTIELCGGLGVLWAGGGGSGAVTSRGGGGSGCDGGATDSSVTGTGSFRVSTARGSTTGRADGRGRRAAAGDGRGGEISTGSRSSHATRGACVGARAAEPATTTSIPRPR